ncbi:hypothetical protein L1987_55162 [Smallanthus sonchifolius]|uniref:Uncharacterized protein n=2 Tax=Smallanthus sonchifolius TaxID=185202 RepID=A0ACB9E8M8_9ASTR|nr:hypothetical protein L1987_55160 [Smallanthus sonchifolius]KAI3755365.1 hypothetical protein L1987_55162 [Smallanthus sonchifolius]
MSTMNIELRDVVLEWASGVSASTEELSAENSVRSWMRECYEFKVDQISSLPPTTSPQAMKGNKKTLVLLMVGLIAAMSILVSVLAILTYLFWWRKKKNGDKVEEVGSVVEMYNEFEMETAMPRRFSYLELAHSTAEFAEWSDSYLSDGLTFFLADSNSVITPGRALGLPVDNTTYDMTSRFVAVEFDTYPDPGLDPADNSTHVGIDINNLRSVASKDWSEGEWLARIKYDSASQNLSVSVISSTDYELNLFTSLI